jgi:hypothetical protein
MKSLRKLYRTGALVVALVAPVAAFAQSQPINFDPTGNGGGTGGTISIGLFDWSPGSSLSVGSNPAGGINENTPPFLTVSQARLGSFGDPNGGIIAVPANKEFTFITGFYEKVISCTDTGGLKVPSQSAGPCVSAQFQFDGVTSASQGVNFYEIWAKDTTTTPPANNLAGTGFNKGTRILYGFVTNSTSIFNAVFCNAILDQFLNNDWPGTNSLCGSGSTNQTAVNIQYADPNYFPGLTQAQIAGLKATFNASNILPYNQSDPSRLFVANGGFTDPTTPEPTIAPSLGPVNGLPGATTYDVEFQSDANTSVQVGTTVAGACRVTYGGNDKNGNVNPNSFGSACMSLKGNKENCYTFGGQVGAPTADPLQGGPFGEHTHHQVSGPAGDFVFHAGTHSAPSSTRITATACYDPGACRQAEANAGFKQMDFEGTGSLRSFDATAKAYLEAAAKANGAPSNYTVTTDTVFYFRVDMDDTGEPGNKPSKNKFDVTGAKNFFAADLNLPLHDPSGDPNLTNYVACNAAADVYQFQMCWDSVNQTGANCTSANAIYSVRAFLTGGNIQLHKVIK